MKVMYKMMHKSDKQLKQVNFNCWVKVHLFQIGWEPHLEKLYKKLDLNEPQPRQTANRNKSQVLFNQWYTKHMQWSVPVKGDVWLLCTIWWIKQLKQVNFKLLNITKVWQWAFWIGLDLGCRWCSDPLCSNWKYVGSRDLMLQQEFVLL